MLSRRKRQSKGRVVQKKSGEQNYLSKGNEVGARAQQLFKMLVEHYLQDGAPVASKMLAHNVDVSSATVRNIMSELESVGLVTSPHTSAGRVPTHQGLRFFVDSLISVQPMDAHSVNQMRAELDPDLAPNELVESASQLLSHVTHMAGVVTMPRPEQVALRQVEFLPLSGNRVLAILVVNEREVQNRVVHTDREYEESELNQAANFINAHFGGKTLMEIRGELLDGMQADKDRLNELMQTTLDVASKAFAEKASKEYIVTGESNLVDAVANTEVVREIFNAFARKGAIVHLLDRCLDTHGIQLFIGEESGYQMLDDYSLITAPYEVNSEIAGVLGVIGPTRMEYQKVIPIVDVTARVLGAAMTLGRT